MAKKEAVLIESSVLFDTVADATEFARKSYYRVLANAASVAAIGAANRKVESEGKFGDDNVWAGLAVYHIAKKKILALTPTKWDMPMEVEEMLTFLGSERQVDHSALAAAAAKFGLSTADVDAMAAQTQAQESPFAANSSEIRDVLKQVQMELDAHLKTLENEDEVLPQMDPLQLVKLLAKSNNKLKARMTKFVADGVRQRKNGLLTWAGELQEVMTALKAAGDKIVEENAEFFDDLAARDITPPEFE